ncbi:ribonuclease H1-like [Chelonus insularis]|uniref:ribonuclease H1-like n=1 Tax=Chelonus insularis TaxID=460826 RepID=UPI0015882ED7|nr:ribonuclease H1-like [Chelonus insularis]XP_034934463.1 ribonuclease H1-like [Chelonus insularis]
MSWFHTREVHFPQDYNGFIHIYTDGACRDNGRDNATAGIGVFIDDDHPENVSKAIPTSRQTNIAAEMLAVLEAVSIVRKYNLCNVIIYTDSEFIVKGVTEWMPDWIRRGWRTSSGHRPQYVNEFKTLDAAMKKWYIRLEYVQGHSGIYGNEMADRLARKAVQ